MAVIKDAYYWLTSDAKDAKEWRDNSTHSARNLVYDRLEADRKPKVLNIPTEAIPEPPRTRGKYFTIPNASPPSKNKFFTIPPDDAAVKEVGTAQRVDHHILNEWMDADGGFVTPDWSGEPTNQPTNQPTQPAPRFFVIPPSGDA